MFTSVDILSRSSSSSCMHPNERRIQFICVCEWVWASWCGEGGLRYWITVVCLWQLCVSAELCGRPQRGGHAETVGLRPGLVACSHHTNWVELKYMLSTAWNTPAVKVWSTHNARFTQCLVLQGIQSFIECILMWICPYRYNEIWFQQFKLLSGMIWCIFQFSQKDFSYDWIRT